VRSLLHRNTMFSNAFWDRGQGYGVLDVKKMKINAAAAVEHERYVDRGPWGQVPVRSDTRPGTCWSVDSLSRTSSAGPQWVHAA
jgi:hypothetical protein